MFRFQNCLFAMHSTLLEAVVRQPAKCIRFASSTDAAVHYFKIEIGEALCPSDRSGVPDFSREEVLQVLVVSVYYHRVVHQENVGV